MLGMEFDSGKSAHCEMGCLVRKVALHNHALEMVIFVHDAVQSGGFTWRTGWSLVRCSNRKSMP